MRTDRTAMIPRTALACAALQLCALLVAPAAHAALCGDASGDGRINASDALATLRLAVTGAYDWRADVAPRTGDDTAPAGDGRITAPDALESLHSSVEGRIAPCHGATQRRAVVSTAAFDFSSAGFAVVDLATHQFQYRKGALWRDSVVRVPSGVPVALNRDGTNGNSLRLFDIDAATLPTIKSCSVEDGSDSDSNPNPQDVVLVSDDKGYVTQYAETSLLVIHPEVLFDPELDPACSSIVTSRIDLSGFDPDGVPQMDQMVVLGGKLYVSLQLLSPALKPKLDPKQNGIIAVIDTATDTVTGSIPLSFQNPFAETKGLVWDEFQQRIFVGGPGTIVDDFEDGGIEAIDPATMQSAGMLLTGADVHADIFDFVIVGTGRAFAIIADEESNSVVDIDLASRTVKHVLATSTYLITDIEMTPLGELWVAYRGETAGDPAGVRIFRVSPTIGDGPDTDPEITGVPIALGQAPFTLAFAR